MTNPPSEKPEESEKHENKGIIAVQISISLVAQTGLLENPQRLDTIYVEESSTDRQR